jgi:hypothetical protein
MVGFVVLIYFLTAYGISNLLVYGSGPWDIIVKFRYIMAKISKTFDDMLSCMMCTSANVGWVLSALNIFFLPNKQLTPFNIIINDPSLWYVIIILDLFVTSGVVWLIHTFQEMCEKISNR